MGAMWTGALAMALFVAAGQTAAAQTFPRSPVYGAPYFSPYFARPYHLGARPLVVRRAAYGAEHRWPYRPDLIVRVGPPDDRCELTYEQTLTIDGLVWRPLVDCNKRY
jgi:hypothetical protein